MDRAVAGARKYRSSPLAGASRRIRELRMNAQPTTPAIEQNPDIRYLGKLLGDVIRDHDGEDLFNRIETIRSASVNRHRGLAQRRDLDSGLDALSLDDTLA